MIYLMVFLWLACAIAASKIWYEMFGSLSILALVVHVIFGPVSFLAGICTAWIWGDLKSPDWAILFKKEKK